MQTPRLNCCQNDKPLQPTKMIFVIRNTCQLICNIFVSFPNDMETQQSRREVPWRPDQRHPGTLHSPSLIIMSYYLLHHAASTDMLATVDLDNIITHSYLDCDCIIPLHLSYNLPTAFCGVESILLLTWAISVDIANVFNPSAVKDTGF